MRRQSGTRDIIHHSNVDGTIILAKRDFKFPRSGDGLPCLARVEHEIRADHGHRMFNLLIERLLLRSYDLSGLGGEQKRVEQTGHIVDRPTHLLQELYAIRVTGPRFAHEFNVAADAG